MGTLNDLDNGVIVACWRDAEHVVCGCVHALPHQEGV